MWSSVKMGFKKPWLRTLLKVLLLLALLLGVLIAVLLLVLKNVRNVPCDTCGGVELGAVNMAVHYVNTTRENASMHYIVIAATGNFTTLPTNLHIDQSTSTAIEGEDFQVSRKGFTLESDRPTSLVVVTPLEDKIVEKQEKVVFYLTVNSTHKVNLPQPFELFIDDDDELHFTAQFSVKTSLKQGEKKSFPFTMTGCQLPGQEKCAVLVQPMTLPSTSNISFHPPLLEFVSVNGAKANATLTIQAPLDHTKESTRHAAVYLKFKKTNGLPAAKPVEAVSVELIRPSNSHRIVPGLIWAAALAVAILPL